MVTDRVFMSLEAVIDPRWKNPRAWTDFRVKMVVFPAVLVDFDVCEANLPILKASLT